MLVWIGVVVLLAGNGPLLHATLRSSSACWGQSVELACSPGLVVIVHDAFFRSVSSRSLRCEGSGSGRLCDSLDYHSIALRECRHQQHCRIQAVIAPPASSNCSQPVYLSVLYSCLPVQMGTGSPGTRGSAPTSHKVVKLEESSRSAQASPSTEDWLVKILVSFISLLAIVHYEEKSLKMVMLLSSGAALVLVVLFTLGVVLYDHRHRRRLGRAKPVSNISHPVPANIFNPSSSSDRYDAPDAPLLGSVSRSDTTAFPKRAASYASGRADSIGCNGGVPVGSLSPRSPVDGNRGANNISVHRLTDREAEDLGNLVEMMQQYDRMSTNSLGLPPLEPNLTVSQTPLSKHAPVNLSASSLSKAPSTGSFQTMVEFGYQPNTYNSLRHHRPIHNGPSLPSTYSTLGANFV